MLPKPPIESRFAALQRGRQTHRVRWPRKDGQGPEILVRVLSRTETQECVADARRRFEDLKIPVDALSLDAYQDEVLVQILYRSCRDPEAPERSIFVDVGDCRDNTTVDEQAAMYLIYRDWQREEDPDAAEITVDELRDIEITVKKKDLNLLKRFGSRALATYLLSMAGPPSS